MDEGIVNETVAPGLEKENEDSVPALARAPGPLGKNTKNSVKFSMKIFEDFLQVIKTDLDSVNKLSNSELDNVLQKFYAGARRKNGFYYMKKSMLAIRFGLQRHFLCHCNKVDIIKHEDFPNSTIVFKCFSAMLKQKGKGVVIHKPAISAEDMDKIEGSLDWDDPVGLQDKVFMDVMLYFYNRGREKLREMTLDSFDICDEGGKCSITLKDTPTKNNRADKQEKSQGGIMIPTNGPRCPAASFLRFKDKLNPQCKSFWQRPANAKAKRELKFNPSSDQWYLPSSSNISHGIAAAVDPKSVPSSSTSTGGQRSESQELRELNEILNEITNNPENFPSTCNILTSSHAHVSSQQVQAPTFNFNNCTVNIFNN
eukprot:XP_011680644.1 PREDICTED: uncharacterized protein LOC105446044 [Strongylocentrotus purpuratus]